MNPNHHLYQTQSPPPLPLQTQNSAEEFLFPAVYSACNNNFQQVPVNLPLSIDLDQSLYDSLSSLNISDHNYQDRRLFLPETLDFTYGSAGEGFSSLEENSRDSNGVSYNQGVYSGVGHSFRHTVDPFLQRASYSGVDPLLDFDRMSFLLAKEQFYYTQQHLNGCNNLRSTTLPANNINLNVNQNIGGVSNLQNHSYLRLVSLRDLRGRICLLAKDQNGCKIFQSKFESPTKEDIDFVLSEVVGSIADLMKDPHANYLMQKLVSVCDDDQKAMIISELTERSVDFVLVCMSQYGTRAIQKLLESLTSRNQLMKIIRALQSFAAQLANDPNGHHVLQFCLIHFDRTFNQPILNQIADNCLKVATDRSGCCVMQACVEHSHGQVRKRLIAEIIANAIQIAEDPFGNYVLQHMVGLQSPELTALLASQLQGNFARLSQNKYASNVVEKCLTESESDISTKIILELVESPNASSLLVDPYGNFVIQSALKVSKEFAFDCLRRLILANVNMMQCNLYGKKILEKIERRKIIHK